MHEIQFFGISLPYYLIALAFLLPRIPFVGKFFNIINTLIHEFGHALMALILQGQVIQIQIFSDTSGVTLTKANNKFCAFLVSLAGYPFAALSGLLCAFLLSVGYEKAIVCGLSILFLFMLILWIRNIYGVIWTILFVGLNAFLLFYIKEEIYWQIAAWFYTLMIIIESVWSSLVLLYISLRMPEKAGDAANLHKFTHVPAVIWGLAFAVFSIWMAYLSAHTMQLLQFL